MANQTIPQRSEVPEEYTWNLKDLYESDQAWNEEYKALKTLPEQITAFRGTLGRSAEDLLAWFRLQDQVEERLSRLYGYASCKGDEDTGNSFYQDMRGKAMSTLVTISSAAAFAIFRHSSMRAATERMLARYFFAAAMPSSVTTMPRYGAKFSSSHA